MYNSIISSSSYLALLLTRNFVLSYNRASTPLQKSSYFLTEAQYHQKI